MQENVPVEEVFKQLRCDRYGLTPEAAEHRLEIFGPNKLEEKEVLSCTSFLVVFIVVMLEFKLGDFPFLIYMVQDSKFLRYLGFMWNPLSWVMEAAAIMAIALANGGVSPLVPIRLLISYSYACPKYRPHLR